MIMREKKVREAELENLDKIKKRIQEFEVLELQNRRLEKTLSESEQKYQLLFENNPEGIFIETLSGEILECNSAAAKMYGYTQKEMIGLKIIDIVPEEFAKKLPKIITKKDTSKGFYEFRISRKKDGTLFPTQIATKIVYLNNSPRLLAYVRDISREKTKEKELKETRKLFMSLFKSNPLALVYLDQNFQIIDINDSFTKLFGFKLAEVKGKNIGQVLLPIQDKTKDRKLEIKHNLEKYLKGSKCTETIIRKKDGTLVQVASSNAKVTIDNQLRGIIIIFRDISEQKRLMQRLEKLAQFDALTGCYNIGHGLILLEQMIKIAKRNKTHLLLFYLDADNFKFINDNFGHQEGNMVLKKIGQLFKSVFREEDIVCRAGGDEFLIICPDSSLDSAPRIIERLKESLEELNNQRVKPYRIDFSIGFSDYDPANPESIEKLIQLADQRMYEDKKIKRKQN
ncbi:MAG: hypothetical protein Kow00103_12100 [Candidatus Caldatribacteriota bacterium]